MAANGKVTYGCKAGARIASLATEENSVERTVSEMRRDPYVSLSDRVLTSNMKAAQITVTAEQDDLRDKLLAGTLESIWYRYVRQFAEIVAYGRVAHEIVWAALPKAGLNVVSELIELPYEDTELLLDKGGRFNGIKFGSGDDAVELEPLYSWWLALDAKPLQPHGKSRYLGAMHDAWEDRQDAIQRRRTFIRKYALGDIVFEGPQWEERDGKTVDVWEEFRKSANGAEAGDVLCMDPGVESDGNNGTRPKFRVTKDPSPAKDGSPLLSIADSLGAEILLAAGIPPKTVIEGDAVGSFALVTQQMLILLATVEDLLSQIGESYQKNVIDKARLLNGVGSIKWTFTPLTQRKDDLAIEIVRTWLTTPQLSPMVTSGAIDLPAMLGSVGIPVTKDLMPHLDGMVRSVNQATQSAQLSFDLWHKADGGICV